MKKVAHQCCIFFTSGAAKYIISYAVKFGRRQRPVANREGNPVGVHAGLKFLSVIVAVYFKEIALLVFFCTVFPFASAHKNPRTGADKVVAFAAAVCLGGGWVRGAAPDLSTTLAPDLAVPSAQTAAPAPGRRSV
ncbi:MAG: hypothetical protein EB015_21540, partial [Methylocystaceae bacterium]|nr:hypothetical protein [Methylocystaceae bacterium]